MAQVEDHTRLEHLHSLTTMKLYQTCNSQRFSYEIMKDLILLLSQLFKSLLIACTFQSFPLLCIVKITHVPEPKTVLCSCVCKILPVQYKLSSRLSLQTCQCGLRTYSFLPSKSHRTDLLPSICFVDLA